MYHPEMQYISKSISLATETFITPGWRLIKTVYRLYYPMSYDLVPH